jgi:hypothetical protein
MSVCFWLNQLLFKSKVRVWSINGFKQFTRFQNTCISYVCMYNINSFCYIFQASFFVVFNKKGTSISYKLRQCNRHNIPVVSPKYVQQCVTKNRLLDTGKYRLADINNNQEFGKGKIQSKNYLRYIN